MDSTDDTEEETVDKQDLVTWLKFQFREPVFEASVLKDACKAHENRMDHLVDKNLDPNSSVAGSLAMKITTGIHHIIETAIKNLQTIDKEMSEQFIRRFPKLKRKFKRKIAKGPDPTGLLPRVKQERISVPLVNLEESELADPENETIDIPNDQPVPVLPPAASASISTDSDAESCASGSTAVLASPVCSIKPKKLKLEPDSRRGNFGPINEADAEDEQEAVTPPGPVASTSQDLFSGEPNPSHIPESDEEMLPSPILEIDENQPPSPAETVCLNPPDKVTTNTTKKVKETKPIRSGQKFNSRDRKILEGKEMEARNISKNGESPNIGNGNENNDLDYGSDTETVVFSAAAARDKNRTDITKQVSTSTSQEESFADFMPCTPAYASANPSAVKAKVTESQVKAAENPKTLLDKFCESPRPSSSGTSKLKVGMNRKLNFASVEKETVEVENVDLNSDEDSDNDVWKSKPREARDKMSHDSRAARRNVLYSETSGFDTSEDTRDSDIDSSILKELDKLSNKQKKFRKSLPKKPIGSLEDKLNMEVRVSVTCMDETILDELRRRGVIQLIPSNKKVRSTLERDIKRLTSATRLPIIHRTSGDRPTKKQEGKQKKKQTSRSDSEDRALGHDVFTSSDDDDNDDGDSDTTVFLSRAKMSQDKIIQNIKSRNDNLPSGDDEDSESELEITTSDGEANARNACLDLPSPGKKRKTRSMAKKLSEEAKKKKQTYITPRVGGRVSTDSDSDVMSDTSKARQSKKKKSKEKKREKKNVKEEIKIEDSDGDTTDFDDSKKQTKQKQKKRCKEANLSSDNDKKSSDDVEELLSLSSGSAKSSDEDFELSKTPKTRKHKRTVGSSSDEVNDRKPKKKARNRIESDASSTDFDEDIQIIECDSDIQEIPNDTQSLSQKGRRNIRPLMEETELNKNTRQAAKEEEDRKKRVSERQQMFNDMFEAPESTITENLILDFDPATKAPLLSVHNELVSKLKPHQCKGIQFMFDATFESVKTKGDGGGCILAHCMGLGKTLQTIAFLHTVLTCNELKLNSALIVCPLNTVGNWNTEFRRWLRNVEGKLHVHKLYEAKGKARVDALECWRRQGGVAIINYEGLRIMANEVYPPVEAKKRGGAAKKPPVATKTKKKFSSRELSIIKEVLLNPGPDIVVCDEGHILKNSVSKLTQAVANFRTRRRIVLTGTPLQNNLLEYHTMMSFVKPSLLGNKKEFSNRFLNPIVNGQHKDSSDWDVKLMKRRAHVLHKLLDGCVQRLDYSVLTPFLPPKYEYAISINLSDVQKIMYQAYLDTYCQDCMDDNFQTSKLFADYSLLVKIWTHPKVFENKRRSGGGDKKKPQGWQVSDTESIGSMKDFIDDGDVDGESSRSTLNSDIENLDERGEKLPKAPKKRKTDEIIPPVAVAGPSSRDERPKDWHKQFFGKPEDMDNIEISGKLIVLMEILKTCESIGDKVLVFSQYLASLDLIEELLQNIDRETVRETARQNTVMTFPMSADRTPQIGRWRSNIEYFRIDGSTKSDDRQRQCDTFNVKTATKAKLFLISTKAGGLGINLVGANRVVIFDASWNPSHDLQSIFRVFRFGQTKPCYVYRLLARGTMEEKIYNRQVVKLSLSCRVVDEQQIERHFQFDEIRQFYQFDKDDKKERPVPIVPKDRLFADLLISLKDWIFSYLEHDSLLENKEEEELTEEERKAAWDEYNNLNTRQEQRPPVGAVPDDAWVLTTATQLKLIHPDLMDWEVAQMARAARLELVQLMGEWDAIHSINIEEITKIGRRAKFDQLFVSLTQKFGTMAEWGHILKRHPPQQGSGASSYIYSYPSSAAAAVDAAGNSRPMPMPRTDENPIIIPGSVVTLNQNATATSGSANNPLLQNLLDKPGGLVVSPPASNRYQNQNQNAGRKRRIANTNQNGRVNIGATANSAGTRLNGISPSPYQPGRSDFSGRPLGTPYATPTGSQNVGPSRFQATTDLYNKSNGNRTQNSSNMNNSARAGIGGQGSGGGGGSILSSLQQFGQDIFGRINPTSIFQSQENQAPPPTKSVISTRPVEYVPPSAVTNNGQPRGPFGGPETILP